MPSTHTLRRLAIAGAAWATLIAWPASTTLAEERPPTASIPGPDGAERALAPTRSRPASARASSDSGAGWWLGTAGIAAALAVFGGVSVASKRFLPARESALLQVVGRSSLSSKHSVYLLRVGDRVLILGAGPQGPPSTLGEVTDPLDLARLAPRRTPRPTPESSTPSNRPSTGFDRRIGDDE
jgi:flagellar protein FliO/FliZ